jgi:hypothetical protein
MSKNQLKNRLKPAETKYILNIPQNVGSAQCKIGKSEGKYIFLTLQPLSPYTLSVLR